MTIRTLGSASCLFAAALCVAPATARASIQFEHATYTVGESAGSLSIRLTRTDDPNVPQNYHGLGS